MPGSPPPDRDRLEKEINLALRRIREAKRRQRIRGFRLGTTPFALAWQGGLLFVLGLLVGIGLHILVTVAVG